MKRALGYIAASILVAPASLLLAVAVVHLWRLALSGPYSSAMFFGFDRLTIGAPWSHVLQILFACATFASAAAVVRWKSKKLLAWILGLAVIVTAFLATSVASRESKASRPNQPPQHNAGSRPSSADSPAFETPSAPAPRG